MSTENVLLDARIRTAAGRQARRRRVIYPAVMHIAMSLGVFIVLFPLLFAFIVSTQTQREYYQVGNILPGTAIIDNYQAAWSRGALGTLMRNTMIVALAVPLGKIALSIAGAFALIYFRVRGANIILGFVMLTHFLPLPVRIVPTFELLADLDWVNTYWGLTIPFFASATGLLLFYQFYRTVPPDLADAARVDGAGPLYFLFYILIPVSRTNIGALFLIEFIYMWNQYLWPLIVANTIQTRQAQIGIKQLITTTTVVEWNILMAGAIVVIIPPLLVLLVLQRSLLAGLTAREG
jgi:sn-glycerol 3-phosphate transport system permease protein